jgi:hypothetical protein
MRSGRSARARIPASGRSRNVGLRRSRSWLASTSSATRAKSAAAVKTSDCASDCSRAHRTRRRPARNPTSRWSRGGGPSDQGHQAPGHSRAAGRGRPPRSAASLMVVAGVRRLVVSKILNHVETGVTAVYDRHGSLRRRRNPFRGLAAGDLRPICASQSATIGISPNARHARARNARTFASLAADDLGPGACHRNRVQHASRDRRNLLTHAVFDKTFKAGDRFQEPDLVVVSAAFLVDASSREKSECVRRKRPTRVCEERSAEVESGPLAR